MKPLHFSLSISPGLALFLAVYLALLAITVIHILRSQREGWDKAWPILGVLFLPFAGMLEWWWEVLWGNRVDAVAKRRRGK